jgi:hypothetical protein
LNTAILKRAGEHGGPIVLAAGATSLLMALIGASRGTSVAAGPAPTVTATVTAPAPVAVRTSASATPGARPGATPSPHTVQAVSDRRAALPHNASGGLSHGQARPPSIPQPSPAAPCSGAISVRLLHAACVSIGR